MRSTGFSTAHEVFVDTSGFYSLLVRGDSAHGKAAEILSDAREQGRRFLTTDYVLDETATLLRARGRAHLAAALLRACLESQSCSIAWMDPELFERVSDLFIKSSDKEWSFTDCMSFRVMKDRGLRKALTRDHHFAQAGFDVLLGP